MFSIRRKKLAILCRKHQQELEYYEKKRLKSQTEIHIKQVILSFQQRIPQLLFQFYFFEFEINNSFEICLICFRLIFTSYMFASLTEHLFWINNLKINKKWTFIFVRLLSNFLFLSSRLLTITAVSLASSYSILIYFVCIYIGHFLILFNFHFIHHSFQSNLGRKFLDCFMLSFWRMNSFLEDMDLSSYCLVNLQVITLENTSILFLFHLLTDNIHVFLRIFILSYVNLAFLFACLIELIVINLFVKLKFEKKSSFLEKIFKMEFVLYF